MRAYMNVMSCKRIVIGEPVSKDETSWRRITFTDEDGSVFEISVFGKPEIVLADDLIDELAEKYEDHDWRIER